MKKTIALLTVFTLIAIPQLFAQFDVGLNFAVVSPESGFKENVDRLGFGISGKFAVKLGESPFYAGLTVGGANYGTTTYQDYIITPLVPVDVKTTNNILFADLLLQAKTNLGFIQPYVEGMIGFNYLWTETKIEELEDYDDEIASHTNFDDFTSNYGVGFGTLIKLKSGIGMDDENNEKKGTLFLDLKVRYMFGGQAEYLKEGSITVDDNKKVHYDVHKSETDFISYHVGILFTID
ncbi:hypothetical protein B6D60_03440 [candidate division KSB1 bacterium 4484_87]|nr:MAG: hypothetical protein B6D60_03440 [candidate division KSB1 bacterium 4484_87]